MIEFLKHAGAVVLVTLFHVLFAALAFMTTTGATPAQVAGITAAVVTTALVAGYRGYQWLAQKLKPKS